MTDKLELKKKDMAEFGRGIIDAAKEKIKETNKKNVIANVEEVLAIKQRQEEIVIACEKNVELLDKRLAAIEAGEFSFAGTTLILNDPELRHSLSSFPGCPNCGMSTGRPY